MIKHHAAAGKQCASESLKNVFFALRAEKDTLRRGISNAWQRIPALLAAGERHYSAWLGAGRVIGERAGEIFNTAMTGYQEEGEATDPSYYGQTW